MLIINEDSVKNNIDKVVNKYNHGKEIFLWKCKYDKENKEVIPLSKRLSYYDEQCQEEYWYEKGSIQRTLARNELVLDLDDKKLLLNSIRSLRREGITFTVWSSGRSGGWIRLISKELSSIHTRRGRDEWRKRFYEKHGGEIKTEHSTCPAEWSKHHKSLKRVVPIRIFQLGREVDFVIKKK